MGNINPRSKNIPENILRILNETYEEFIEKYGEKHSQYIKEKLEELTEEGKIEQASIYYYGNPAMANDDSIIYSPYRNLVGILKHEIWHTFNFEMNGKRKETILRYIPEKYKEIFELGNTIKEDYELRDEIEKWTEWFNQRTHTKSSTNNFINWGYGFFTKKLSSDSSYDRYTSISDMISCIIPTEKLLDMFLHKNKYDTGYSYFQMIDEFDNNYADALDEKEKGTYKYPYLKILMDTKKISEEPTDVARQTVQDCFKTCFNAYLLKLQRIKNIDINLANQIYSEIKYMQENMMWNIDVSQMKNLEYIKVLEEIQEEFKNMVSNLEKEHPEVKEMIENVDYEKENPYELVEDGMNIARLIQSSIIIPRKKLFIANNYKTAIGSNGIKGNLYASMAYIFGNKTVNLLFKNFQEDLLKTVDENILLKFHGKIQEANTKEDYVKIYNELYELFAKKLDDTLNTDENIDDLFDQYGNIIINLQKYGLFNEKSKQYLPSLENIISIYNNKVKEYEKKIDISTEKEIIELKNDENIDKKKKFYYRFADKYKNTLQDRISTIDMQRKQQSHEYKEIIAEDLER